MSKACNRRVFCGLVIAAAVAPWAMAARPGVPDFCFLQVSDIHISPQPVRSAQEQDGRSAETLAWVCEQAKTGQRLEPFALTTPPPAFVLATGDLTEYGVIGKTWDNVERYFKPLSIPLYVVPGNHDNTWTGMMPIMRKLHGGDHYSFDKFGCHFAGLDTASIQEPLPGLEARTLNWLREDLKRVAKDRPVFIFQHHPLGTTEFATPFEQLRLLEVIREHNVVLLLMGHGHGVRAERWNTLDSVMGGSTFGVTTGYSIISVMDGVLRVVYRYRDPKKPMEKVLEKPIAQAESQKLELVRPAEGTIVPGGPVPVSVRLQAAPAGKITADVDGRKGNQAVLQAKDGRFEGQVPTKGLLPGSHYLHVLAEGAPGESERAVQFFYERPGTKAWAPEAILRAGMKAGPVLVDGGCVVATTDGQVVKVAFNGTTQASTTASRPSTAKPGLHTLFDTKVEIIHAPAVADGNLYFSSAELGVFCVGLDGKLNWKRPVGAAVYGTPAVMGDAVYVGDLEGFVHAIDRTSGKLRWSKRRAAFSIEMPLLAKDGVLYFGAWDGFVYAVNAADGSLKWKQPGPAGQTGEGSLRSRYYAPADCPPIMVGQTLFVADRSYRLGAYGLDGKYMGPIAEGVAAVGLTQDGKGFYTRGVKQDVARYNAEGKRLWSQPLEMGRFPCPPVEAGGRVYACSNLGVLTALNAGTGQVLWQYQVSPQLHVMAPVAADGKGNVCVVGMDGTVTRVQN